MRSDPIMWANPFLDIQIQTRLTRNKSLIVSTYTLKILREGSSELHI